MCYRNHRLWDHFPYPWNEQKFHAASNGSEPWPARDYVCPRNLQMSQAVTAACPKCQSLKFFYCAMEKFLKRKFTFFLKRGNIPLSPRPDKIALPPLPNGRCYRHVCDHAAAQQGITCGVLWCWICAVAHICTGVPNTADTSSAQRIFRGCFKSLQRIAPHVSSQEFNLSGCALSFKDNWHVLVLVPSWTREVKSTHWNGSQYFIEPSHTGRTFVFSGDMQGWR